MDWIQNIQCTEFVFFPCVYIMSCTKAVLGRGVCLWTEWPSVALPITAWLNHPVAECAFQQACRAWGDDRHCSLFPHLTHTLERISVRPSDRTCFLMSVFSLLVSLTLSSWLQKTLLVKKNLSDNSVITKGFHSLWCLLQPAHSPSAAHHFNWPEFLQENHCGLFKTLISK